MALNGLFCADVRLRNYSLTHSLFCKLLFAFYQLQVKSLLATVAHAAEISKYLLPCIIRQLLIALACTLPALVQFQLPSFSYLSI